MKQSIRFWHYGNGAVLLKIEAGQTLRHSTGAETEEGWTRETNVWEFDGRMLVNRWHVDGRDCDGRLTQYGESTCCAGRIMAGYCDHELGIAFPAWEAGKAGQRDYSAEAMNY